LDQHIDPGHLASEEIDMLLGFVVITVSTAVAVWVNDYTTWGGPEFEAVAVAD
jgi:hypothetical protein